MISNDYIILMKLYFPFVSFYSNIEKFRDKINHITQSCFPCIWKMRREVPETYLLNGGISLCIKAILAFLASLNATIFMQVHWETFSKTCIFNIKPGGKNIHNEMA